MKNVVELRTALTTLYSDIKSGSIDIKNAAEMNNTAGKIIGTVKLELEYAELAKVTPKIAFLDGGN